MPGEAEGLQIPVSFTLAEAQAALKQLEQMAKDAGKKIGAGLDPGGGGGGGGGGAGAQKGGIFALKEGMGKAREATMFFTSALGEFGESGRRAQGVIAGVAGAFLGGGGLLLGLELGKAALGFVIDAFEAEAKAAEAAKKRTLETAAAVAEIANAWRDYYGVMSPTAGDAEKRHHEEVNKILADQSKIASQLNAERAKLADLEKSAILESTTHNQSEVIKGLEADLASLNAKLLAASESYNRFGKAKDEEALRKLDKEYAREVQNTLLDTVDQEAKILVQAEQQKTELRLKYAALGAEKVAALEREINAKAQRDIIAQREKDGLDLFNAILAVRDGVITKLRESPGSNSLAPYTLTEFLFGVGTDKAPRNSPYGEGGKDLSKEINNLLGNPQKIDQANYEDRLANLDREWDKAMKLAEAYRGVKQEIAGMGAQAVESFAGDAAKSLLSVTRQSAAYERAMKAAGKATSDSADLSAAAFASFAQNAIASVAEESATRAIFETAMGLAALARSFWDPTASKEAGLHFASAAEFGMVSLATGAAAFAIGQTRGMTAAERASVNDATAPIDTTNGAREVGGTAAAGKSGPTIIVNFSGKALVTEPEVKRYLADLMKETRDAGWVN